MNQLKKQLLCSAFVTSISSLFATTSNIVPRSQSFNAARQLVGWNNPEWGINRLPQDSCYTSFNLIFEYTRTFRDNQLAQCLFGNDLICGPCDSAIHISGSAVAGRNGTTDWLADYFGLPRDFQSTVSFKPSISNFILDFSFYAGLDAWAQGLYFRIHGPFVHTKWNMNAEECIAQAGTLGYFQGYFSSEAVPVGNLNTSFLAYANGCTPTINNNYTDAIESACLAGTPPFDVFPPCRPLGTISWQSLCCSRINNDCDCNGLSRNGFGELRFVLGYNFLNSAAGDYHLGAGIYTAAPTGSRVGDQDDCDGQGRYLFQPIVGNGKHWELGAQITAHHIWWRNEQHNRSIGMYLEANVTHLFGARQTRCFDLCSAGNNSRYMLAQRLESNRNDFPESFFAARGFNTLGLGFANEYAPVANLTSRNVTSTIAVQGDVALSFAYQSGNFQWDIGYDFWGRSCEKLCVNNDCCYDPTPNNWTLKGDTRVYGFQNTPPTGALAVAFSLSDSNANIHTGSNLRNGADYSGPNPATPNNFYADNPQSPTLTISSPPVTTLPLGTVLFYTSNPPILISDCDLNLTGTRGISNKFFTHLNWAWADREDTKWTPYIGIGAEAEFGPRHDDCCNTSCYAPVTTCKTEKSCCENCALSQWGVWFKVGSSYN